MAFVIDRYGRTTLAPRVLPGEQVVPIELEMAA